MNIQEMHQYFRVYGEQMGLELIRNILPEEIDIYLNTAINEKVREVLSTTANVQYNDRISVQNNPISPISYIQTLYSVAFGLCQDKDNSAFYINRTECNIMIYLSFYCTYSLKEINDGYKCRYIDANKVSDVLNDFCNGASHEYPIVTHLHSFKDDEGIKDYFKIYTGEKDKYIGYVKVTVIKNPAKVSLEENISCDLPDYVHTDIVQLACQKYFNTLRVTNNNVNQ